MAFQNNYFKIGLLACSGFVLFIAGLLAFGLRERLAASNVRCVTLFSRSVQGLSIDAPVKFRGFSVGRVVSISLAAQNDLNGQPVVEVIFEVDPDALHARIRNPGEAPAFLRGEIARGLKAYITLQGVTGLCFLDLNYSQDNAPLNAEVKAAVDRTSVNMVYMPNGPSQIFEIGESINRLTRTLNEVDFVDLGRALKETLKTLETAAAGLETAKLSGELTETLAELRQLSASLRLFAGHMDELFSRDQEGGLGREMEASARQLRQTLKRLDQLLGSSRGGLPETLDNLRAMSANLRELSELLKAQPSQALFGRPPRPTTPEPATPEPAAPEPATPERAGGPGEGR